MISVVGVFIFIYVIYRLLTDGVLATDQVYSQVEFFDYANTTPTNFTLEWIQSTPPSFHTYEELPYLVSPK